MPGGRQVDYAHRKAMGAGRVALSTIQAVLETELLFARGILADIASIIALVPAVAP